MERRTFVVLAGTAALVAWGRPRAQTQGRVYRVGILLPGTPAPPDQPGAMTSILAALRGLGYVEGSNLRVDARHADGRTDRLPLLARELAQLPVDLVIAIGATAARAAQQASSTIPIVLYGNVDPVAIGLVSSLARPDANMTGVLIAPEGTLAGKKLELLKEVVPRATRIAFLAPDDPAMREQAGEVRKAAAMLGLELQVTTVHGRDYATAFAAIARQRPDALFVASHTFFSRDRKPIIALAAQYRLPAIYEWREHVEAGGLLSYGSSREVTTRKVAATADRILKGASPRDIPFEQPTNFELFVNRTTAKALGVALPPSLLVRAEVLE